MSDLIQDWGRPYLVWHFRSSSHARWEGGLQATIESSGWYMMQAEVKHLLVQ